MLTQQLIQSALWLTGKSMDDMEIVYSGRSLAFVFSIERFCYYLLSPEFIEKYRDVIADFYDFDKTHLSIERFAKAIWYYQKWNEQPLIDLLSKIK